MAEEALNMSLDDLIAKSSKKSERKAGTRDGKAGRGIVVGGGKSRLRVSKVQPTRTIGVKSAVITKRTGTRQVSRGIPRSSRLAVPSAISTNRSDTRDNPRRPQLDPTAPARILAALDGPAKWDHNGFAAIEGRGAAGLRKPQGTKLLVSNLDHNVSEDDIRELCVTIGPLRSHELHYDKSGRSLGSAEVVFVKASDAQEAFGRYNNVQLDGKPMRITFEAPAVAKTLADRLGNGRGGGAGSGRAPKVLAMDRVVVPRRGAGPGAGRRGPALRSRPKQSQTDLDEDLKTYMDTT